MRNLNHQFNPSILLYLPRVKSSTPITASIFALYHSATIPVVVTKATIYIEEPPFQPVADTLYATSSTPRTVSTSAHPFCCSVPVVVTRAPIEIENPPFQPISSTLSPLTSTPRTESTYENSHSTAVTAYF